MDGDAEASTRQPKCDRPCPGQRSLQTSQPIKKGYGQDRNRDGRGPGKGFADNYASGFFHMCSPSVSLGEQLRLISMKNCGGDEAHLMV